MIGCIMRQLFLDSQSLQDLPFPTNLSEKLMYSHFAIIEKLVLLNSKFILQKMGVNLVQEVVKTEADIKENVSTLDTRYHSHFQMALATLLTVEKNTVQH